MQIFLLSIVYAILVYGHAYQQQYKQGGGANQYGARGGGSGGGGGGGGYQSPGVLGGPRHSPQFSAQQQNTFQGPSPSEDDPDADSIVGVAGRDYPVLSFVPETGFSCSQQQLPGIYADTGAQCQVFHICQPGGIQDSFLCPNGSIFNQRYFVCDWWYNVNCADAPGLYGLNAELYKEVPSSGQGGYGSYQGSAGSASGGQGGYGNVGASSGSQRGFSGSGAGKGPAVGGQTSYTNKQY